MIDGELFGHSSEITSLMWLEPYPLLVTTDAAGNLCVWAVRPVVVAAGSIVQSSPSMFAPCILKMNENPYRCVYSAIAKRSTAQRVRRW
jgi:hypothetical protein